MNARATEALPADIAEIEGSDRAACLERWHSAFERAPPQHLSSRFMKRVLVWEIQCRLLGGVSNKTDRVLRRLARGEKVTTSTTRPGSHLIREWNGRTYQVEVTGDGYVMDGRTWRSLSAIARHITEEGLDQEFNSLDAQREACEAYVASQKHEGWELLPDHYDDGGISGGHLDRPALQRLMRAVDEKRVDQIVVYKIDRLTRSLADFAKIVDILDEAGASFVSVTQSFNTATSMGRLTLNMLLSFAQFEREVTAERIRDKIAATKKKGLWMGGNVPLGYEPDGRTLKIKSRMRRLSERSTISIKSLAQSGK